MKFIRKHSEGPWLYNGIFVEKKYKPDILHANISGIKTSEAKFNSHLASSSPEMLDYIIERAEIVAENIAGFVIGYEEDIKELDRLLDLIKRAGVEVIGE